MDVVEGMSKGQDEGEGEGQQLVASVTRLLYIEGLRKVGPGSLVVVSVTQTFSG